MKLTLHAFSTKVATLDATGAGSGLLGAKLFTDEEAGRDGAIAAPCVKARFLVKLIAWTSLVSGHRLDLLVSPAA
jgi:hypothetical protein